MAKRVFDIAREFALHPKVILGKARELGIEKARVVSSLLDEGDTARLEQELCKAKSLLMKPCLRNRQLVEVQVGKTWKAALKHRVYSCPDTPTYNFVSGATALLLNNKSTGWRVPLNVEAALVYDLRVPDLLETAPETFRARLSGYKAQVQSIPGILDVSRKHRFYFLSDEPWPEEMQKLTGPSLIRPTEWSAILSILNDPEQFFQWPRATVLLWQGCVRTRNDGEHIYPEAVIQYLARLALKPDTRTNGPAILSFLAAEGKRPNCGNEGWPIHHIFDGTEGSPHAIKEGDHFTQSAGLVAAHPIAHDLAHRSALLKWLLHREAFMRFDGYDPAKKFTIA
jgi:hypothetical protein